ncbi:hypothetical protein [Streptosporangium pseudovulgare]|uniref:Methanol dehydrogenase n=1 Tax=Streptosporangium pseudovulgare TaxID=35765 RepID=A0ABQ2QQV1_9ACTN|nr:hypothetical protein [Streptosporangium pseudovulgare]GGP93124.1 hypothetical protein GCM10010140_23760 [Streptosporangium pseudovulgare]
MAIMVFFGVIVLTGAVVLAVVLLFRKADAVTAAGRPKRLDPRPRGRVGARSRRMSSAYSTSYDAPSFGHTPGGDGCGGSSGGHGHSSGSDGGSFGGGGDFGSGSW